MLIKGSRLPILDNFTPQVLEYFYYKGFIKISIQKPHQKKETRKISFTIKK